MQCKLGFPSFGNAPDANASARIMFMREFPVITSAESVEKLRLRLNSTDLEQFGEAFIPEYVYEVIKRLPRFSSMRVSCSAYSKEVRN